MNTKITLLLKAFFLAGLLAFPYRARAQTFPYATPANHVRVVAWNLEFFNDRGTKTSGSNFLPDRTSAQLDLLAARIKGFDASVIALQEIDQISALNNLRTRLNAGGGSWQVITESFFGGLAPQQNALLYDSSKVTLVSSAFVSSNPTPNPNPNNIPANYPTWTFRSPATAVFTPVGHSDKPFRVISIHAHWSDPAIRNTEGYWLANYVASLLAKPSETKNVLLMGDFNGETPVEGQTPPAPHNGLVSGDDLSNVVKRNGDITMYAGTATVDHIYVTPAVRDRLSNPTSFVIRPEYYGESGTDFRASYSDHLPVFVDFSITPLTPRQSWRRTNFGSADNSGDGADINDFDGDGLPNLLEYAFGKRPKVPDLAGIVPDVIGNKLQIAFPRDPAATDLTYTVQASPSLAAGSWADIAQSVGGAVTAPINSSGCAITDSGTGPRTVSVTENDAFTGSSRFLRVKVSSP
jgi:endonuclease/exonuclease/phosphatase family metal-dependent hydrolase